MNEFEKNQGKGEQTGEQGEKPVFGQFDKEQGQQGQQGQQDSQELGQKGEQFDKTQQQEQGQQDLAEAGAGKEQGDDQFTRREGPGQREVLIRSLTTGRPRPAIRARPFLLPGRRALPLARSKRS